MRNALFAVIAVVMLSLVHAADAAEIANAQISQVSSSGSPTTFQYALTLNDTGTTTVGTFWFGWIPGQDYLKSLPTSITSPAGWQDIITGSGTSSDGYAIQWSAITPASDLAAGHTLSGFGFDSPDTLAQVTSDFSFSHPTAITGTSFIYAGTPESDAGFKFVVTSLPEPGAMSLFAIGAAALLCRPRRRLLPIS